MASLKDNSELTLGALIQYLHELNYELPGPPEDRWAAARWMAEVKSVSDALLQRYDDIARPFGSEIVVCVPLTCEHR